ncbi:MAG: glycosyltransferase family 9 protein [Candidatus Fermentibacteraceae bacterium]|nr:glycosyltransferase family 9 protein [Candidatus Fermentibacteraceae bacterium]MBN2608288.1 glycosyltransferase family 9 protein [Candidatus Fermentibacteraceae bacterium]
MMAGVLKKLETGSRKLLFRALASGISSAEIIPSIPPGEDLGGILLMRQDRIGDMIMTLPLIRKLRDIHPGARIGVVASESNSIVLEHEEDLEVIVYRKGPAEFTSSLLQAREFAPDAAVDMHMHDSTTSLAYALASGARWRLHVHRDDRLPFNVRVPAPQDGHIMDAFSGLLCGLGRPFDADGYDRGVRLSGEERNFARYFWDSRGYSPGDCAAVNISAGGPNREWGTDRYLTVCRSLKSMGLVPLVVSAPRHRERALSMGRELEGVLIPPPTPTILHLAAILEGAVLLVSPDTSVVHLAASMGIPVVGMYLPFDPALPKWYPWMVPSRVIMSSRRESLDPVSPEDVSAAVREILAGLL